MGDVSGHGFDSALLMASVHAYIRSLGEIHGGVGETLRHANAFLAEEVELGRFGNSYDLGTVKTMASPAPVSKHVKCACDTRILQLWRRQHESDSGMLSVQIQGPEAPFRLG